MSATEDAAAKKVMATAKKNSDLIKNVMTKGGKAAPKR